MMMKIIENEENNENNESLHESQWNGYLRISGNENSKISATIMKLYSSVLKEANEESPIISRREMCHDNLKMYM
jgi:hypothetical protein